MNLPQLPTVLLVIAFLIGIALILTSSWQLALGVGLVSISYFELRKRSIMPKDALDWLRNLIDEQKKD